MRGREGGEALANVTRVPVKHQGEAQIPFTQDNFVDGLVQFIVATDQVFFPFLFSLYLFKFFLGYQSC